MSVRVVAVMAGHVAATLFGVNREMFAQGARRAPATEKRMETKKAQQLTARQEKKTNIAGRTTRNHRQYHSSNNSSPEKLRFANPTNDETKRGPLTLRMRLRLIAAALLQDTGEIAPRHLECPPVHHAQLQEPRTDILG